MTKAKQKSNQSVILFRVPTKTKISVSKKLQKAGLDMSTVLNILLKNLDELDKISFGIYGVVLDSKKGTVAHRSFEEMVDYIHNHKD